MKNKIHNFDKLGLRILLLGATIFMMSFFTDIPAVAKIMDYEVPAGRCSYGTCSDYEWSKGVKVYNIHDSHTHWGFRHVIYFITMLLITIIQGIRIIMMFAGKDFSHKEEADNRQQ